MTIIEAIATGKLADASQKIKALEREKAIIVRKLHALDAELNKQVKEAARLALFLEMGK